MLRNILIVVVCFAMLASVDSLAAPVAVTGGILTIPPGGTISFPDGTFLNSSSRMEGGIAANAEIVSCSGVNECFCGPGKVVKALLSINCQNGDVVQSTGMADFGATGWGAWCVKLNVEKQTIVIGGPGGQNFDIVSQVYYSYTAPSDIYIACTTP